MLEKMRASTFPAINWTLDYVQMKEGTMPRGDDRPRPSFTMKSLLCAVAHDMPTPPSLDPNTTLDRFLLLATTTSGEQQPASYLIQLMRNQNDDDEEAEAFSKRWTKRPFQYSSAISYDIAEIVIEILNTLCKIRSHDGSKQILWDPTCGSGTFLALALRKGYHVEGFDRNQRAVEGSKHNLEYMFSCFERRC
jgi:hypothetical protein